MKYTDFTTGKWWAVIRFTIKCCAAHYWYCRMQNLYLQRSNQGKICTDHLRSGIGWLQFDYLNLIPATAIFFLVHSALRAFFIIT